MQMIVDGRIHLGPSVPDVGRSYGNEGDLVNVPKISTFICHVPRMEGLASGPIIFSLAAVLLAAAVAVTGPLTSALAVGVPSIVLSAMLIVAVSGPFGSRSLYEAVHFQLDTWHSCSRQCDILDTRQALQ